MFKKCFLSQLLMLFMLSSTAQSGSEKDYFSTYEVLEINPVEIIDFAALNHEIISFNIGSWQLTMWNSNILASEYQSKSATGYSNFKETSYVPLTGSTSTGSKASLTIGERFMYGFIEDESETYYLEPLSYYNSNAVENEYIIYPVSGVKPRAPGLCGYLEEENQLNQMNLTHTSLSSNLCYEIEYAICNDYSMVLKYGSVAGAEAHAVGVTNNVNNNYNDEFGDEIRFIITGQYSVDCLNCDPWTSSTDPETLLGSFRNWANSNLSSAPISINYDIASLWSNRDFDGNVIGAAYLGEACGTDDKYNILQDFNNSADLLRVLVAHELGHNLNATHDPTGSSYIMSPSITNTTVWSSESIYVIDEYIDEADCFTVCPGVDPQINFDQLSAQTGEESSTGVGPCGEQYTDVWRQVTLSHILGETISGIVDVDPGSTATEGLDYDVFFTDFNFTPGGGLTHDVLLRIYNDAVEESDELIKLNLSISSGTTQIGPVDIHMLTIKSTKDKVNNICCSASPEIIYGSIDYSFNGIFYGTEDAKSRTLLTASQLSGAGLTAGYIDGISFYVKTKNSTGAYNNFRVGMKQVTFSELPTTWFSTTEVFFGDYTTTADAWNKIVFTDLFYWNGTSNLYFDFCFNNTSPVGRDYIYGFDTNSSGVDYFSFRADNGTDGCQLNTGSYFYNADRQPYMKFTKVLGAEAATVINSFSSSGMKVEDVAHFYSDEEKLIASLKNIGNLDLGCVDMSITNAGNGRLTLPFGGDRYTQKNFNLDVENQDAYYELTLYYTDTELNVWGGQKTSLDVIQSENPLNASSENSSEVISTFKAASGIGNGTINAFSISSSGSGYFAATERAENSDDIVIDHDVVIALAGNGIVLKNKSGQNSLLSLDGSSSPQFNADNAVPTAFDIMPDDFIFTSSSNGILLKRGEGGYSRILVDNDGNLVSTYNSSPPLNSISIDQGNLGVIGEESGIVFKNPENKCWRLIVDINGNPVLMQVGCKNISSPK
jgi:hypothetical protein